MRRIWMVLLALAVLIAATGCSQIPPGGPVIAEVTTAPTQDPVVTVRSVDELLAAIESNREICLEAGTYHLEDASDYGMETDSPYYSWVEVYDGFELKLRGVRNLVIRGSGKDSTTLCAEARYADVLNLQNCTDILLEDFTAGHTEGQGECSGGVLMVQGCMDVKMNRLGLYGCGVNGLWVEVSSDVKITDSDIYDCSNAGVMAEKTDGLTVENCRLYGLGTGDYGGYTVFGLTETTDVKIENCEIRDNKVHFLIHDYPSDSLSVTGNTLVNNRVREAAFDLYGASMLFDSNVVENNQVRNWYMPGSAVGVDAQGNPVIPEMLSEANAVEKSEQEYPARREVHVSTVDEFLAAIAPDTEIILDEKLYDFSTATGYGVTTGEYYRWEDIFDGPGLVITDVENFAIRSNDGKVKSHTLAAIPRYANVLTFSNCRGVTLSGFTAGHTEEPGSCMGGVLMFRDCDEVLVEKCGLYGCGILGVQAEYSSGIAVADCDIYDCSQGGIQMYCVDDVAIDDCTFRRLGGAAIILQECSGITVDEEAVQDTYFEQIK